MTYQVHNRNLKCIQTVLDNQVNRVSLCLDSSGKLEKKRIVIELKSHDMAKELVKLFYAEEVKSKDFEILSYNGNTLLLLPYREPRPIESFFPGERYTLNQSETLCMNLVIELMSSGLPYPVLYLIERQRLINFTPDLNVYINYAIDFSKLEFGMGEKDCVLEAARIVSWMLEPYEKKKAVSHILISKRARSTGYYSFTELYKDLTLTAAPIKKNGLVGSIVAFFKNNKDRIFKVLLVLAVIVLILVILSFLTQFIFGDIPWLRIFFGGFKKIGTQSLLQ